VCESESESEKEKRSEGKRKRENEFNSRIVSDEANLQLQYEDMFD